MNPAQLLAQFDRLSDMPDAVPSLRRFILDLAVRGKLVEQDPRDEPASELLNRIQAGRARLVKASEKKKEPLPDISDEGRSFELPHGWCWVRFGEIFPLEYGDNLPAEKRSNTGKYPVYGSNGIVGSHSVCFVREPCIVVGRKGSAGALNLSVTEGCCVTDVAYYCIPPRELDLMFSFKLFHTLGLDTLGKGIKPGLNRNEAYVLPLALPPLAEQHRIVVKVDELMALCDRLEAAQALREIQRDRLAASSLSRLNNGADPDAFRNHARFTLDNLPRLTTRLEHIQQLRQTILNLAVRGKLVSQDPKDEPASELLKRIEREKEWFIKEGTLRKEKPLPPVTEGAAPFPIPTSWSWARIGTCSLLTEYGTSVKSDNAEKGVPVLKMGDIQGGQLILGGQKKVPRQIEDLPQLFLERFDLLYNRTNSAELVGKTGIYLGEDNDYTFASYLIRIRFINELMSPVYSNLAMNAPYFRMTQIMPELQQQCGQANVNGTKLRNMMIPIPPLAEQHRIVAKVGELMALCDRLEAQLTTTQTESRRLLEAVLHEALTGAADETKECHDIRDASTVLGTGFL